MKPDTIQILFDGSRGIYIPQEFAQYCDHWCGLSDWARGVLTAGPNHPDYWFAWEQVLENAYFIDSGKREFTLHQNGDLFAVCLDEMSESKQGEFFE